MGLALLSLEGRRPPGREDAWELVAHKETASPAKPPWRVAPLPRHLGDGQAGCSGQGNGSQEGARAFSQDGPRSLGGGQSFPKKGYITILPQPLPYPLALQPRPPHFPSCSPFWLLCGALLMGCSRLQMDDLDLVP